jgi:hypothetical protein
MGDNYKPQSLRRQLFKDFPILSDQVLKLSAAVIVARVRPRTSKGITDLLLLYLVQFEYCESL